MCFTTGAGAAYTLTLEKHSSRRRWRNVLHNRCHCGISDCWCCVLRRCSVIELMYLSRVWRQQWWLSPTRPKAQWMNFSTPIQRWQRTYLSKLSPRQQKTSCTSKLTDRRNKIHDSIAIPRDEISTGHISTFKEFSTYLRSQLESALRKWLPRTKPRAQHHACTDPRRNAPVIFLLPDRLPTTLADFQEIPAPTWPTGKHAFRNQCSARADRPVHPSYLNLPVRHWIDENQHV